MKFAIFLSIAFAASGYAEVTRTSGTVNLADVKGAPGNECITFRNNGEIVEAACVATAVDRQLTPGTNDAGVAVLKVERSFGAEQAAALVGVEPCVGFNGTDFLAQDCNALTAPVTLVNGELVAGKVCSSGVDAISQLTVSIDGTNCAQYTSTVVQRTLDNAGTPAPADPAVAPVVSAPAAVAPITRITTKTRPAAVAASTSVAAVAAAAPPVAAAAAGTGKARTGKAHGAGRNGNRHRRGSVVRRKQPRSIASFARSRLHAAASRR